ncbi:hypothetical protein PSAB6_430040 [Paraburkholderia sabiae]|nr:hypothetical protein PSAB6_430040 [Paraburkholderia sabiae]
MLCGNLPIAHLPSINTFHRYIKALRECGIASRIVLPPGLHRFSLLFRIFAEHSILRIHRVFAE